LLPFGLSFKLNQREGFGTPALLFMDYQPLVKLLRQFRSLHKYIGVTLAFFVLILATTGILLGWKKNVEVLQPATLSGSSKDVSEWKSFAEISASALLAIDSAGMPENTIDRMDVRFDKGMVKVLFKNGYWEAQVDLKTAKVLSVAQRHADWIEHIHDGSIISDGFKLGYTNILAIGLLTLALSGLWLWYGPKVIRKSKDH
jgi:uncharacterized iron-regulated membrane protein